MPTVMEVLVDLHRKNYPPNHPELRFMEWMQANAGRLREALAELGVEVEEGDNYFTRMKLAVMEKFKG